ANYPCTGQCTGLFVIGEQKEGIFPEVVHDQVEQEQHQEEAYYEEEAEGGGDVESEQESSDSDDGFTNVLDPLSRQAKELIANDSQDMRKLQGVLVKARGKVGLNSIRKALKKHIQQLEVRLLDRSHACAQGDPRRPQFAKNVPNKPLPRVPAGQVLQNLRCRSAHIPMLLGRGGANLNRIENNHKVKVDVLQASIGDVRFRKLCVTGLQNRVASAVLRIRQLVGITLEVGELERGGAPQKKMPAA
ncbi:unnamed protein product, partial [Laminaria digitata]